MSRANDSNPNRLIGRGLIAVSLPPSLALSAMLMAMSLGTHDRQWLAWVGLIPLLAAARMLRPLPAACAGAGWGLFFYAAALAAPSPLIEPGPAAFVLLALVPAGYAFLASLVTRALGFVPLMLALLWILAEIALQPLGLRSGLLATTQGDGNLASYVAGLLGYALVASAIVYANAWLLAVLNRTIVLVEAKRPAADRERCTGQAIPQGDPCLTIAPYWSHQARAPPIRA